MDVSEGAQPQFGALHASVHALTDLKNKRGKNITDNNIVYRGHLAFEFIFICQKFPVLGLFLAVVICRCSKLLYICLLPQKHPGMSGH